MKFKALLVAFLLAGLGVSGGAAAATHYPAFEQLLAITLKPADLEAVGIPGQWTEGGPDFTPAALRQEQESGFIGYASSDLAGWPASGTLIGFSSINLYEDPASAAAGFRARESKDVKNYGPVATGPAIASGSRYHERPAKDGKMASRALRVHQGKYLVLVGMEGTAPLPKSETLVKLARTVVARLEALDAKKLPVQHLPPLADALPDGDDLGLSPIATVAGPSDWWVWMPNEGGGQVPSVMLRNILRQGMGSEKGVFREFLVSKLPRHGATVSLLPFKDQASAEAYLMGAETTAGAVGGKIAILPPNPKNGVTRWQGHLRVGRHVAEIQCFLADSDDPADPNCEAITKGLADRVGVRLKSF